jgi:hypothetical protein
MSRVRLTAFAGIGVLAALQWGTLLADPPIARLLGAVAVATLLGWALSRVGGASWHDRRLARGLAVLGLVAVATVGSLLVLGLPLRALPPWGWDRLRDGLDVGLTGLGGSFDYPFHGAGEWARLLLVVPLVPLTIAAAVLTFRPGRAPGRVPIAGLLTLIVAFAIPAAARPTGLPVLWGGALLMLVAIWLWDERARALPAIAVVAGFGVVAIPVATSLAADDPPVDYRSWTLPGVKEGTSFDWEPQYGPIDWPRTGELLFRVHTDHPSFWRAEVLDEFYADGWRRSGAGGKPVPGEPVGYAPGVVRDLRWTQRARFDVLALDSDLVISPGSALQVRGLDSTDRDADGTMHTDDQPITAGTSYALTAYAPDPRAPLLRSGSRRYHEPLAPYTALALPDGADLESIVAPTHVDVPLWGHHRGRAEARRRLRESAYSQVARLAERLTAGKRTAYDAAVAIDNHLRTTYSYDEGPRSHRLPLRAFLFRDRFGYCQQFSGAMALMLRMVGIPARVATGFAPGTATADGRGFEVTDLDAHSWVEVYFNGIGWVPFDPTPPSSPATIEIRGAASFGIGASEFGDAGRGRGDGRDAGHAAGPEVDPAGGGGGSPVPPVGLIAALSAVVLVVPPLRSLRHRRLPSAAATEREVEELRRVLRATGWSRGRAATLLLVEGRLRSAHHGAAASYVRRFRDRLYGAKAVDRPTLADRRSARRDLASDGGLRARARLLLLMPPGAPLRRGRGRGSRI